MIAMTALLSLLPGALVGALVGYLLATRNSRR